MKQGINLQRVAKEICDRDNLKLISDVGGGGFKETFHIKDAERHDFALKIYHNGLTRRSIREIEVMQELDHPGFAKLILTDEITVEGSKFYYLVEEFLGGGTLGEKLRVEGTLSRDRTLELGQYLIDAIAFLAQRNLVHRDIKPENILYRIGSNHPVLTDFGIARDLDDESFTPSWADMGPGTWGFASPEQMNNEKHLENWRSDQFSLGIVLSLCGLGIHPYDHGTQTAQYISQRKSFHPNFKAQATMNGLPVIIDMVDPWPVRRYKSPEELSKAWNSQ